MPGPSFEVVYIHHIDKSLLSSGHIRAAILNALKKEGQYAQGLLNQTVATWSSAPTFPIKLRYAGGFIELAVQPQGSDRDKWKWVWLDKGTRIRYATMSRNFKAKTRPGSFASSGGQGGLSYVSKKHPHPGIAARGWSAEMARRMDKRFARNIDRAVRQAIFGHQ